MRGRNKALQAEVRQYLRYMEALTNAKMEAEREWMALEGKLSEVERNILGLVSSNSLSATMARRIMGWSRHDFLDAIELHPDAYPLDEAFYAALDAADAPGAVG